VIVNNVFITCYPLAAKAVRGFLVGAITQRYAEERKDTQRVFVGVLGCWSVGGGLG
jgi:hypothetical protein